MVPSSCMQKGKELRDISFPTMPQIGNPMVLLSLPPEPGVEVLSPKGHQSALVTSLPFSSLPPFQGSHSFPLCLLYDKRRQSLIGLIIQSLISRAGVHSPSGGNLSSRDQDQPDPGEVRKRAAARK